MRRIAVALLVTGAGVGLAGYYGDDLWPWLMCHISDVLGQDACWNYVK